MLDEGYIKFNAEWTTAPPLPSGFINVLNPYRDQLYQLGLIGAYENGIGFGNISIRVEDSDQFIITGSTTGNFSKLTEEHYTKVEKVAIDQNTLWCSGPIVASSESMSHAAVYHSASNAGGVIHIHHLGLWEMLLHQVPTTDQAATYGSPEMAYSIMNLFQETSLKQQKIFVMEGHREGIFVFGESLEEAITVLLFHYNKLPK